MAESGERWFGEIEGERWCLSLRLSWPHRSVYSFFKPPGESRVWIEENSAPHIPLLSVPADHFFLQAVCHVDTLDLLPCLERWNNIRRASPPSLYFSASALESRWTCSIVSGRRLLPAIVVGKTLSLCLLDDRSASYSPLCSWTLIGMLRRPARPVDVCLIALPMEDSTIFKHKTGKWSSLTSVIGKPWLCFKNLRPLGVLFSVS